MCPRQIVGIFVSNPGALAPDIGTNNLQLRSQSTGASGADAAPSDVDGASVLDDNYAILVLNGTSIALFTNAAIWIRNPSASARTSFMFCEIFYS